jgi:hypothetical protein
MQADRPLVVFVFTVVDGAVREINMIAEAEPIGDLAVTPL